MLASSADSPPRETSAAMARDAEKHSSRIHRKENTPSR